jgi:hypothetical protein
LRNDHSYVTFAVAPLAIAASSNGKLGRLKMMKIELA